MSTPTPTPPASPPPPPVPPAAPPVAAVAIPVVKATPQKRQIIIVSHSPLFYWWPVWALGFLMAIISYFSGDRMVTVPAKTESRTRVKVEGFEEPRNVLVLPAVKEDDKAKKDTKNYEPHFMYVSSSKNVGVVFVVVLLIVIAITNIPLRGLWSFVVIMFIVFITILFAVLEWWETIFRVINFLDIRINMAAYLVISTILFILWLVIFLLFDQQMYMIFEPGQLRVRQAIGDAEISYDTTGMTTQKQRSDLFRHWILGLGSGDLIVRTSGAHPVEIHMNNVLFIGRKHAEIEEMLRSREVLSGEGGHVS